MCGSPSAFISANRAPAGETKGVDERLVSGLVCAVYACERLCNASVMIDEIMRCATRNVTKRHDAFECRNRSKSLINFFCLSTFAGTFI